MSNFRSKAFNPASKRVEDAEYCDDYYGRHRYGIRFDDGCVHPEAQCGIDAAATQLDALQARVKELEAALGCKQRAIAEFITGDDKSDLAQARASEAYMSGALSREIELCQAAESRATRLQQERDEAVSVLKVLSFLSKGPASDLVKHAKDIGPSIHTLAVRARDLVRRLAGPEKEGK